MNQARAGRPPLYYGWYVVGACVFIALVTNGARNSFGIFVLPMSEEFGWSRGTISLAASLGFLVNGLTQPFLGQVLDRLGGRKVILTSLIVFGLATVLLSLTFHFLFLVFMFGFLTATAMSGVSLTNTGALLSKWFRRKRATVVGLNAIGLGVSPATAAIAFGFMMGLNVIGSIAAGVLSDRFSRKNLLALTYFLRGCGYVLLLAIPGELSLWAFAAVAGFSWIATAPLTTSLTADFYGLRALGTISGVSFLFHSVGSFTSILLGGFLYDVTGSYTLPFAIAGALLFPAALSAFTIKERKFSARYLAQPAAAVATGD